MPDRQHAAHGDIDLTVRQFISLLGIQQHIDDALIHGHGAVRSVDQLVDRTQILHAFKAVIDGKQTMILAQKRKYLCADHVELVLILGISRNGRNSIKVIKGIFVELLIALLA